MINLILISIVATAQSLPGEEIWSSNKTPNSKQEEKAAPTKSFKPKAKATRLNNANIPKEYLTSHKRESNQSLLIQAPKGTNEVFLGIKVGDIVNVLVRHSVIAFPDEKSPVISEVVSGPLRGYKLIGESYLEPNSKRIFININTVALGHHIYSTKAVGVSEEGQPGIVGKYHSREAEYFTGDFIASFAAGYFDSLVPRRTNVFGQIEHDPTVDNAVKKGLANGALSTAERFRNKLKKVPEFSEVQGSFNLKIMILEQVKNLN